MYYNDFYYISSPRDIEHKVNWGFISWGCIDLAKNKKNSLHIVYEFQSLW